MGFPGVKFHPYLYGPHNWVFTTGILGHGKAIWKGNNPIFIGDLNHGY